MSRFAALLLLVILSPLLGLIAVAIWLSMGRPVLFSQERSGQYGVPFHILKFRTMRSQSSPATPDVDRITRVGRLLRLTSLDELPSLWNLIRGEMAFVGPRPFIASYQKSYNELQRRRLEVKPGLTGWTQINGRNSLTWDEKFELDAWYVDHRSSWLDLKIILRTVPSLFRPTSISHDGHATMPLFIQNDDTHQR